MPESSAPTASVIILNWNGQRHLPECFAALGRQTTRDFEVVLVDNGSSDGSVTWVKRNFPHVRTVELTENRGFPAGNNAGVAEARGRLIILLNNDTRPADDWLERLVACAEAHPRAGIVAAHLVDWDGATTDSAGDGCRVTGRGFGRHRRRPVDSAPASGPVFGACAGAALYRRELIDDVGFLDDDFFLNFEDTDLAFRARLRGWEAWFCREAVVHHRISASQGAWSATNAYFQARNHLWVCAKNMPAWVLVKYAPLNVLQVLALGFVAWRHGSGGSYVRGLIAGVRGLPCMARKRHEIMARRTITTRELNAWLTPLNLSIGALRRILGKP